MSKWIKFDVFDEKTWPEFEEEILLVMNISNHSYVTIGRIVDCRGIDEGLAVYADGCSDGIKCVTHWRPIPDPPTMKPKVCPACGNPPKPFETDSIDKDPYKTCAMCGEMTADQQDLA
jgi:hypothetical protein